MLDRICDKACFRGHVHRQPQSAGRQRQKGVIPHMGVRAAPKIYTMGIHGQQSPDHLQL